MTFGTVVSQRDRPGSHLNPFMSLAKEYLCAKSSNRDVDYGHLNRPWCM